MNREQLGKKETYELWYELFKLALQGMNIGLSNGDVFSSGEENVCNLLKDFGTVTTLFDVGANAGDYTKMLSSHFPNAKIHCFEPAKESFNKIKDNLGNNENIILNNIGISDNIGESNLYYDIDGSRLASLYKRDLDYLNINFTESEVVPLTTLDDYCKKNHIGTIDFLKMDIEGNELRALMGSKQLLAEKRICAIQIEFGGCNIDSRTYFKDFWNLLHKDYDVYRILKNGFWKISNYTEKLECFSSTNFLFLQKNLNGSI